MNTNKQTMSKPVVKPGSFWFTSWGYDQTNVDFIVVKRVSPTGKTAICQVASKISVDNGGPYGNTVMPSTGYGSEFRMTVKQWYDGTTCLRGSYPFVASGEANESRRPDTFRPVKLGETKTETDILFGH